MTLTHGKRYDSPDGSMWVNGELSSRIHAKREQVEFIEWGARVDSVMNPDNYTDSDRERLNAC